MGGMSDYALDVMSQPQRRQAKKPDERKKVPTSSRDANLAKKIAECAKQGISMEEAMHLIVEWNAAQPSPMKVGLVKQRVYEAYRASGVKST